MARPLRRIPSAALEKVETWPGITRQEAVTTGEMWSGLAQLEPGATTGWHHHGEYETSLYVVAGVVRLEFGLNGAQVVDCSPGDFIHVPAGEVHRELNPGSTVTTTVMTRVGRGQAMFEVDGPPTA
jgi:uncharacterized RmlC-like cupin family protein